MKTKTVVWIIVATIIIGTIIFMAFRSQKRKKSIDNLIVSANRNGSDTFTNTTNEQVYDRLKYGNITDIENITVLFQKKESNWTIYDKKVFGALWQKLTGEHLD